MAFMTNLLIAISLVAVAQAGYAASYAGGGTGAGSYAGNGYFFNPFAGFSNFPGFGTFTFPPIRVPDPEEVANVKPADGQTYSGIVVSSTSHVTKDKDGNVVKTGGSTVLTNDNGDVNEYSVGDNPPALKETNVHSIPEFVMPEMPKFIKPKFPKIKPVTFKPFKHHTFKHHVFEPITFKPIVFEPIKPIVFEPIVFKPINIDPEDTRKATPGENEHFVATHVSSFSHSSNINGVKSSSVGSDIIVNKNGVVEEKSTRVEHNDKPEDEVEKEKHDREEEKHNREEDVENKKHGKEDEVEGKHEDEDEEKVEDED